MLKNVVHDDACNWSLTIPAHNDGLLMLLLIMTGQMDDGTEEYRS